MNPALTLDDVYLTLPAASGPVEILKGVSFRAMPGESVAVVGPSGSGKSSLIAVSTGIERTTSGKVDLLGETLIGKSEDQLARLRRGRVSLVFQSFHLLGTMNAFDNVRAPLEIAGLANVDDLARSALSAVGLAQRMDHYPGQLSGGERQRVAVARALASNPAIVFADGTHRQPRPRDGSHGRRHALRHRARTRRNARGRHARHGDRKTRGSDRGDERWEGGGMTPAPVAPSARFAGSPFRHASRATFPSFAGAGLRATRGSPPSPKAGEVAAKRTEGAACKGGGCAPLAQVCRRSTTLRRLPA